MKRTSTKKRKAVGEAGQEIAPTRPIKQSKPAAGGAPPVQAPLSVQSGHPLANNTPETWDQQQECAKSSSLPVLLSLAVPGGMGSKTPVRIHLFSDDYFEVNLKPKSAEFKWIEAVMAKTSDPLHMNNTFNHKISFNSLKVSRVVRVQNPDLWLDYERQRRKKVAGDHLRDRGGKASPLMKVKTDLPNPAATRHKDTNEFFLFHGAPRRPPLPPHPPTHTSRSQPHDSSQRTANPVAWCEHHAL